MTIVANETDWKPMLEALLREWHEAGRAKFAASYPALAADYDGKHYHKWYEDKSKYVCINDGDSGAFMLEKSTGRIFSIKAYGTPDRRKFVGLLGEVTAADLVRCRWMRPNLSQPLK